jgi:hypothetical protein
MKEEIMKKTKKCRKHPKYKGILEPRVDCNECWEIYNIEELARTAFEK